ncbi:MAG: hypothetical protein ACLVJ8_17895 [Ruthenibacterium lactatiformans]
MASVDMHDIDLKEFNEVLAACKGDVFMVTPEGDRLNLKSRLCQLIGFTKLIEGGSIAEAKLECSDPEDQRRLFRLICSAKSEPFHLARRIRGRFCVRTRGCARFLQLHRLFARSWTVWFDTVFYKVVL